MKYAIVIILIAGMICFLEKEFYLSDFFRNDDEILLRKTKIDLSESKKTIIVTSPFFVYENGFEIGSLKDEVSSDFFNKLDKRIYQALVGKSGSYQFAWTMHYTIKNKYGNDEIIYRKITLGQLDADELNKYSSVEFWSRNCQTEMNSKCRYCTQCAYLDSNF